jgi:hypothetical protein
MVALAGSISWTPLERQRHPAVFRPGATAQAGQAALRNNRQAGLTARHERSRDAPGIHWPHHRQRMRRRLGAPVVAVALGHLVTKEHRGGAERLAQRKQRLRHGGGKRERHGIRVQKQRS